MSTPTAPQLSTLDFGYLGVPFNNEESKSGQNTNSLDFAYLGLPFVAAIQPTVLTYNPTQMLLIF